MFGQGALGCFPIGQPDDSIDAAYETPPVVDCAFSVELTADATFDWEATGSFNMGVG